MKKIAIVLILIVNVLGFLGISGDVHAQASQGGVNQQLDALKNAGQLGQACRAVPYNFIYSLDNYHPDIPYIPGPIEDAFFSFFKDTFLPSGAILNGALSVLQSVSGAKPCDAGLAPTDPNNPSACLCVSGKAVELSKLCQNITKADEQQKCITCSSVPPYGVWTGVGCIRYSLSDFITQNIFGMAISFAGIFALLCIIYSAIKIQLSRGDAEKIEHARENMTSCILGLLMIIFSVFILRLIGVDILGISF